LRKPDNQRPSYTKSNQLDKIQELHFPPNNILALTKITGMSHWNGAHCVF